MRNLRLYLLLVTLAIMLSGCYPEERQLIKNPNNSGELTLTHHYGAFSLGPCGFSRNSEVYDIKTPRDKGRIESSELSISGPDLGKYQYSGYIQFLRANKVYVELYRIDFGVKTKLAINGVHKINVTDNASPAAKI